MNRSFQEFLQSRIAMGGFTTEDAIQCFLPLARQVLAIHVQGKVAVMKGATGIEFGPGGLQLLDSIGIDPTYRSGEVEQFSRVWRAAVDVVDQVVYREDLATGRSESTSQLVATQDDLAAPLKRAVYLPGYEAWEQRIGHHDPLSDTFVLGLILASLAQSLPLFELDQVRLWQQHRRQPFQQWPDLHPLLAQTICRLTELDRQKRQGDLAAVISSLENYREQPVDLEFDLGSIPGFRLEDVSGRRKTILTRLKERLFDLSRRNRLLHDAAGNLQSLDLTQASIPLTYDPMSISPDRIWIWNAKLKDAIARGNKISLGSHLNFAEAIYLPAMLDRIRSESRRDLTEYGFEQLRLVACYLTWCDIKSPTKEFYRSPLVLIPVKLHKKKGVRDQYELEPMSHEAEINPVIRHRFEQLYGIRMPEAIDLTKTDLDTLHAAIEAEIRRTEPAVTLEKIDRPRIALLHAQAKRRLETYRRRAQRLGRGVRSFADIAYSYDPTTYDPAGLKLFREFIQPQETLMDLMLKHGSNKPRQVVHASSPDPDRSEASGNFAHHRAVEQNNPFLWTFDLCSLTLANLRYRRMTLVRDYDALLEQSTSHAVFDSAFSGQPPDLLQATPAPIPIRERFDVLHCDPTQATAISRARSRESYIIQGPPGTGKSQTIANLIADFVGQGLRVLFVCEKRAAIDVVHARLRQRGIGHLACLIHDTQSDKRAFIEDLKLTQDRLLEAADSNLADSQHETNKLHQELELLQLFDEVMKRAESSELTACRARIASRLDVENRLLQASIEPPRLSLAQLEALPDLRQWHEGRDAMKRLYQWLQQLAPGKFVAEHPLRWLDPAVAQSQRPIETITQGLKQIVPLFAAWRSLLLQATWKPDAQLSWSELHKAAAHLSGLSAFSDLANLALVDSTSEASDKWKSGLDAIQPLRRKLEECQKLNEHWLDRLSPSDTDIAIDQAERLEKQWWKWLSPTWWKLQSNVKKRYRFKAHSVAPSLSFVLSRLRDEHQAAAEIARAEQELLSQFRWSGSLAQLQQAIEKGRGIRQSCPTSISEWLEAQIKYHDSINHLKQLAAMFEQATRVEQAASGWLDSIGSRTVEEIECGLPELESELGRLPEFMEPLKQLGLVAPVVRETLRRLPLGLEPIEQAILDRSIQRTLRSDPRITKFTGDTRDLCQSRLEETYRRWLDENARRIEYQVASRFRTRVKEVEEMGRGRNVDPQLKDWAEGLKELRHEFNKSMRHRAIRDLVSDNTGDVIKAIKPVWLMSPLSVSDALPLDPNLFDVVIFDEASQITLEDAVPTLFRANQTIVVGDEKQMPPTRFFSASSPISEEEVIDDETSNSQLGLEETSFLAHAARVLPSTLLGWHYRSRSESLISYSNWRFYEGRLLTAPEEAPPVSGQAPIEARNPEQGADHLPLVLQRAISFHRIAGTYEKRRNRAEAEYISHLVRALLKSGNRLTIGVVAFSEAQQDEIDSALDRLASEDSEFRDLLEAEREREDDGQFCGLLVKNLENIQGDERDLMILSVCYGPDANGRMLMNFGPINQSGGEKRLNVAFSRSKQHMVIVSSIYGEAITNTFNPGAAAFRDYLVYASAMSQGKLEQAQQVLRTGNMTSTLTTATDSWNAPVVSQLQEWLEAEGFEVVLNVGQSRFVVDVAIRAPGESAFRLGILLDGQAYYERSDLLEREMMRPKLLTDFGWKLLVVLGKDWYENRESVKARVLQTLQGSVSSAS